MAEVSLIPKYILDNAPKARMLSEEEQKLYEEACKEFGSKAQDSLKVGLNGSNLWKVLLLNQIGIKTATLPELEIIVENNPKFLEGHYEDAPSVILRSKTDSHTPNNYLAQSLVKKLKVKKFDTPLIITRLGTIEDNNSEYGLNFDTKEAEIIKAPDFAYKNNGRKFKRLKPDYTIEFAEDGERTLYTRPDGVSWLFVGGALGFGFQVRALGWLRRVWSGSSS